MEEMERNLKKKRKKIKEENIEKVILANCRNWNCFVITKKWLCKLTFISALKNAIL